MRETNFYENLDGFEEFGKLANTSLYAEVPNDWFVVLSDIRGSTAAIESGRYRDVNLLGAASIAVVQNALDREAVPFSFGGDGATFLVPASKLPQVKIALQKLIQLAQNNYSLNLRVGIVPVGEVYAANQKILVAKFKINKFSSIAMMKGGGLNWAEKKIKSETEKYCLTVIDSDIEVPTQLSCRWQPIKSTRGRVLSLLVQPRENNVAVAAEISSAIETVCDGSFENSNPIANSKLKYNSLFTMLRRERKLHSGKLSFRYCKRALEIMLCWWAFKLKLPAPFPANDYKSQMQSHSDYRKYDDVLRLILDCTPEQTSKIKTLLEDYFRKGEIYFGMHESTHALLTCLVESIHPGGHIHFVDGSDGGYAVAAKQLKQQIANA